MASSRDPRSCPIHAPDGFLNAGTAVATGALSLGTVGAALRHSRRYLSDKHIPLAGIAAAFIFAAQMFNFPVAAGTTGHLLGGALAAILLGPATGAVVVTVVVIIQALVFADGGLTALGYNTLNLAVVPAFGGYAAFRAVRRLLPSNAAGVVAATGIASLISVLLASFAFSLEWLFGASAPVPFDTVFGAMVGVHLLIGVGEAAISALTISAVLSARPDLVFGARDLDRLRLTQRTPTRFRTFAIGAVIVALAIGMVVSQFAADSPDGLERVAADTGFATAAKEHPLDAALFADYATTGIGNPSLSLALAGAAGVLLSLAVGAGVLLAMGDREKAPTARRRVR